MKCFSDGTDTVVCEERDGIQVIIEEIYGEDHDRDFMDFEELPPDQELSIAVDGTEASRKVRTVREWIEIEGKGHLCSTEY